MTTALENDASAGTAQLLQEIHNLSQNAAPCFACAARIPLVGPSFTCSSCACRMCHPCMTRHAQKDVSVACPSCRSTFVSRRYYGLVSDVVETEEKHRATNDLLLHAFTCQDECSRACDKMVQLLRHAEQVNKFMCTRGGEHYCKLCAAFVCVAVIHARRCVEACPFPTLCTAFQMRL